jgi:hypothetical protein
MNKENLLRVLSLIQPIPPEWYVKYEQKHAKNGTPVVKPILEPLECTNWIEFREVWTKAMTWTDAMDIALSSMMAVVASTDVIEDQVWLRLIGKAGTAKTTLCEAFSTNIQHTFSVSVNRGFHSGSTQGGKDNSLFSQMDGKTAIINEADTLLTSPNCAQTLSEMRDMWSRRTRAVFRNGVSYDHEINTTFIIAGTPTIRRLNKSAAGDRFLDCIIYEQESIEAERNLVRGILGKSKRNLLRVRKKGAGEDQPKTSEALDLAYRKTSGFINYIRDGIDKKLEPMVDLLPASYDSDCEALGLWVAYMRTRPTGGDEDRTDKELHVRLSKQLYKLGACTAAVMDRPTVDAEVLRRLAHIAEDTCWGLSYEVVKALSDKTLDVRGIAVTIRKPEEIVRKTIVTLLELQLVKSDQSTAASGAIGRGKTVYRLSMHAQSLLNHLRRLMKEPAK